MGRKLMGNQFGKGCNETCKGCDTEYQRSQCVSGCIAGNGAVCGTPAGHEDDTRKLMGEPKANAWGKNCDEGCNGYTGDSRSKCISDCVKLAKSD